MKKAATCLLSALFLLVSVFSMAGTPKAWKAVLKLEGKGKTYTFTSDAIYGGYQSGNQKVFLFGKNHMFLNQAEPEAMKVFHDLCTTNAMQQFQFEAVGLPAPGTVAKAKNVGGNISFKKKQSIQATCSQAVAKGNTRCSIQTNGSLKNLGYNFTPEAEKIFTGQYTLTFISAE